MYSIYTGSESILDSRHVKGEDGGGAMSEKFSRKVMSNEVVESGELLCKDPDYSFKSKHCPRLR